MAEKSNLKDKIITSCIDNIADGQVAQWFENKLKTANSPTAFFLAFGMVNKKLDRVPIRLGPDLIVELKSIDPSFNPDNWTQDQFCRLALLLNFPLEENNKAIEALLGSADVREQVTIYKSLVFLENAPDFAAIAANGIRSNVVDVYDAIAHHNAFPSRYFSEDAWNQMVMKGIFNERPIFRIYNIDDRKNPKLAEMLHDYVHERWSAGRPVSPEIWRLISGFLNDEIFADLKKAIANDTEIGKIAAVKAIEESNNSVAISWLKDNEIAPSGMTWDEIGHAVWSQTRF